MIRYLLPIRDFFLKNPHLKLSSVFLALLLWLAINAEPKSEVGFRVPLEYRNPPPGIETLGDMVNTIEVRVSASSSVIKRLDASDITAAIDLTAWGIGERTYFITPESIQIPFSVRITKITPSKVRLRFEPTKQKIIEIRPRIIGKVAGGYKVDEVRCDPSTTVIEGPEGHLAAIHFVSTDSIDVTGRAESYNGLVNLYVEDPLVRFTKDQRTSVQISIVPASGS